MADEPVATPSSATAVAVADEPPNDRDRSRTEQEPTRIDLPACADIRVAAELRDRCLGALQDTGDVRIGCGDVDRVDAAVLQCLGALAVGLGEVGRRLEFTDRTEAFDRAVALLGFDELLASGPSSP